MIGGSKLGCRRGSIFGCLFDKTYSHKGVEPNSINSESWDKVKGKFEGKNLIILADPGMGKTTFLQLESSKFANSKIIDLVDGRIGDDDVKIPIFIKLIDFAKSSDELIDAIPILIKRDYRKIWSYIEHIIHDKLESGKFVLFLDALDEVTIKDREELRRKLNRFCNDYQGREVAPKI
jgi:predicted NACHT family NTPase